jgi:multicomponent Na+:H+ antiporter subunit D
MLSISGIPPFGCFWSKIIIIIAAIKSFYYGIAFICVIVSIITLGYFLKLQRNIFYSKKEMGKNEEVNLNLLMPMVLLSVIIFFSGLILIPELKIYLDKAIDVMQNFSYIEIMEK